MSTLQTARHALEGILKTVIIGCAATLLIGHFVLQGTHVYGQSMEPNLHTDQQVLIEKMSYKFHLPERGDIVVVNVENFGSPLIKRVIGLPGETIRIVNNQIYINNKLLEEPYLQQVMQSDYGPRTIPPSHVFVLGDNREISHDSRALGPIHVDNILGKAWLSYWPPEAIRLLA